MSGVLKGNFETEKKVEAEQDKTDVESKFEKEALKHLGGSIAFVAKKRVKWDSDENQS